jgi:hypothetical protein
MMSDYAEAREGPTATSPTATPEWNFNMILASIVARLQGYLAKRRQYSRLVADIQSLSHRDLVDMRGDRTEMLRAAYQQVYGPTH